MNLKATAIIGLLGFACSACGNDSPSAPSPPQAMTLNFSPTVPGDESILQNVTVQFSGQMTATLRWNDSGKDLNLVWTNVQCVFERGDFVGMGCQVLNQSALRSGNSETLSGPVAAGSLQRLFIFNFSTTQEATSLEVTLRPFLRK
jgi:hypothetical protein